MVAEFEKLSGIVLKKGMKNVYKIELSVVDNSSNDGGANFTDVKLQEGSNLTMYDKHSIDMMYDVDNPLYFNAVTRGSTTIIVPYKSELPYQSFGEYGVHSSGDITTPCSIELSVSGGFDKDNEQIRITKGLNGRGFNVIESISTRDTLLFDGFKEEEYKNEIKSTYLSYRDGPMFNMANNDNKITIHAPNGKHCNLCIRMKGTRTGGVQADVNGVDV